MEHFNRYIPIEERGFERRIEIAYLHIEHILFDGCGKIIREGVLKGKILIVIVFPGRLACSAVRSAEDGIERALSQFNFFVFAVAGGLEFEIGICQHIGRAARAAKGIAQHTENLLYLRIADMFLFAKQVNEIMFVNLYARVILEPLT